MLQKLRGVAQKVAGEGYVFQRLISGRLQGVRVKIEDGRAGIGQQDWRMGGNNELRFLLLSLLHEGQKRQLARRRQGGLRLVQQVEAAGPEARLEKGDVSLAMRNGVEVVGILAVHRVQLARAPACAPGRGPWPSDRDNPRPPDAAPLPAPVESGTGA